MFWSGNYIVVRELNFLLKEENVTLSQVLEADDILQECKADNKALMQFLTRPDILAELITLITEEPPKNVELAQQYRHASIACEVLTSPLSMLSDRLSQDTAQMNRLCDFINRDPPLNPLLASYFSKTVEMLLERSPKQDWYLYHIVCLRVLDFFKSRRDFLPNLLRHISTSAIADTFKYFIRLDDLFNKIIMEWLEEHQFIENLILIICGTYVPEPLPPAADEREKGTREPSEKGAGRTHGGDLGDSEEGSQDHQNNSTGPAAPAEPSADGEARRARAAAVASANAAALLCDLVATGCASEGAATRSRTALALGGWVGSGAGVRALLGGVFTSGRAARSAALLHGGRLLRALLDHHRPLGAEGAGTRSSVELAVAPHLPLLHQALLHHPQAAAQEEGTPVRDSSTSVGAARIQIAALLAHLAASSVSEVTSTMLTLGTPGVLVDMFFRFPSNNFLHAQVHAFCRNALHNPAYRTQYARHLLDECDLLTRLMDAYEENENKQSERPRSGYMGHATLMLGCLAEAAPEELERAGGARWAAFRARRLQPALLQLDAPLGGSYPSENTYEVDNITDALAANYDFSYAMATVTMDEAGDDIANDNEMCHPGGHADSAEFIADGLGIDDDDDAKMNTAKSNFLELASQRFDDDMWDDGPDDSGGAGVEDVLNAVSPWESAGPAGTGCGAGGAGGAEQWARFEGADAFLYPAHADLARWPGDGFGGSDSDTIEAGLRDLVFDEKVLDDTVSLANNLLTAMSAMSPQAIANIVNANLTPLPLSHTDSVESTESTDTLVQSTDVPVQSTDAPVSSTDAPVQSTDAPVSSTDAPVQSTDAPVLSTDASADRTELSEISSSDPEVRLSQNLPSSDSPLENALSPADSLSEVNCLKSNDVSRALESKHCDRTEPPRVNDISHVENQTSDSDSPTRTKAPTGDASLESTNDVIAVSETPVEVSEIPLDVSETSVEATDANER